jgi:hypothetical protein
MESTVNTVQLYTSIQTLTLKAVLNLNLCYQLLNVTLERTSWLKGIDA